MRHPARPRACKSRSPPRSRGRSDWRRTSRPVEARTPDVHAEPHGRRQIHGAPGVGRREEPVQRGEPQHSGHASRPAFERIGADRCVVGERRRRADIGLPQAQRRRRSSQSFATSVSLLSRTTSRSGCSAMPRLTEWTKPRLLSLLSSVICPARPARADGPRFRGRDWHRRPPRSRRGSPCRAQHAVDTAPGLQQALVDRNDDVDQVRLYPRRPCIRLAKPPSPSLRSTPRTLARNALPLRREHQHEQTQRRRERNRSARRNGAVAHPPREELRVAQLPLRLAPAQKARPLVAAPSYGSGNACCRSRSSR